MHGVEATDYVVLSTHLKVISGQLLYIGGRQPAARRPHVAVVTVMPARHLIWERGVAR